MFKRNKVRIRYKTVFIHIFLFQSIAFKQQRYAWPVQIATNWLTTAVFYLFKTQFLSFSAFKK